MFNMNNPKVVMTFCLIIPCIKNKYVAKSEFWYMHLYIFHYIEYF